MQVINLDDVEAAWRDYRKSDPCTFEETLTRVHGQSRFPRDPSAWAAPIITAGGVVLIAGTTVSFLRAFDVRKELWKAQLPANENAIPASYLVERNGKQYVLVAVGGHPKITEESLSDSLITFALPD